MKQKQKQTMMSNHAVDEVIDRILGKWCVCCCCITQPYIDENGYFPCCNGCWHRYDFWTPENLKKHANIVATYRGTE